MHGSAWPDCPIRTGLVRCGAQRARGHRPPSCQCDSNGDSRRAAAMRTKRSFMLGGWKYAIRIWEPLMTLRVGLIDVLVLVPWRLVLRSRARHIPIGLPEYARQMPDMR